MRPMPVKRKKKFHMGKGRRLQLMAWSLVVGMVTLLGGGATYAWYTLKEREAETKTATVMKPYYLELRNPNESDVLQLSIGSLLQGKTKQIVFCVSSEEAEQINQDTTVFDYALELIHTDNLALNYEIYPLQKVDVSPGDNTEDLIITEHEVTTNEGTKETAVIYWQKTAGELIGTDVSAERWEQVGLLEESSQSDSNEEDGTSADDGTGEDAETDADIATQSIINRGTYISYEVQMDENGNLIVDNNLELTAGAYSAQYFVLEIEWKENIQYSDYVKETDMIYLLAKKLQPEPEEVP